MKLDQQSRETLIGVAYMLICFLGVGWFFGGIAAVVVFFGGIVAFGIYDLIANKKLTTAQRWQTVNAMLGIVVFVGLVYAEIKYKWEQGTSFVLIFGAILAFSIWTAYIKPSILRTRKVLIEPPPPGFLKGVWKERGVQAVWLLCAVSIVAALAGTAWFIGSRWPDQFFVATVLVLAGSFLFDLADEFRRKR